MPAITLPPAAYVPAAYVPPAQVPPTYAPSAGLLTLNELLVASGRTIRGYWDARAGVVLSGSAVDSWTDQYAGGVVLAPAGTAPNFVASGGPNDLPFIGPFLEGATHRDLFATLASSGVRGRGMLAVVRERAASNTNEALNWFLVAGQVSRRVLVYMNSPGANQDQTFAGVNSSGNVDRGANDNIWTVLHSAHRNDSTGAAGDARTFYRINGGLESEASSTRVIPDTDRLRIGSTGNAANIDVVALWVWTSNDPVPAALTADERAAVAPWFLAEYGVAI